MKIVSALDVIVVLGHAAEFHNTNEGVRAAAIRILPDTQDKKLQTIIQSYIDSPAPLDKVHAAIAAIK